MSCFVPAGSPELARIIELELSSECFQVQPSVIHAGHYFLEIADGRAIDYLEDPDAAKKALRDLIKFSRDTWDTACRVVASTSNRPRMIILVNDWQFLVPKVLAKRERESSAARVRKEYYANTPELPKFHSQVLMRWGLTPQQVLPASSDRWLFSESVLRNRFARTLKTLMKDPITAERVGLSKHFDENHEPIISATKDGQECQLLFCGNSNCAGEVVELLHQLYDRGVRCFLNIYPAQCRIPVEQGTEIARQIFGLQGMRVVNVAVHPGSTT